VLDLAFGDKVLDRAGDIFDRDIRIAAMLIEEIDAIRLQTLQRGLGDGSDALEAAIEPRRRITVLETEFRGDDDLIAKRRQRFANNFLIEERAILARQSR
jgi:hypothetical protein